MAHEAFGQTGHVSARIGRHHEPMEATGTLDEPTPSSQRV
ncbi:hypothetical protein STAFG_2369 [Streptomyces afghaniensis 772]|uniref:Uncharacterized protein n=1 Tax=Streptomyces afghaniensis 772 TaxID=1283301 RepID=S4MUW9_9ACTN|nr:hypothetical protein STAFG_2369 [Streptomyces afghaniensis 772]